MAIRHKRKSTTGYNWQSSDLVDGQIGVNTTDGSLHILKTDNSIANISEGSGGSSSSEYFSAYDFGGFIPLTTTGVWHDITLDTERQKTGVFTHSINSAEVTINADGKYLVSGNITVSMTNSSRTQSRCRLVSDLGPGFNEVGGTFGLMYHRTAGEGGNTASFTTLLSLTVGDKLKLQAGKLSGAGNLETEPNSCALTILKV